MYLNKLAALASITVLMAGCATFGGKPYPLNTDVKKVLHDHWKKTVEVTGIDPATNQPEVLFMDVDLYLEIVAQDCESRTGNSKEKCLTQLQKLEGAVLKKTGKDYDHRYKVYAESDWIDMDEDCVGEYDRVKEKKEYEECVSDKKLALKRLLGKKLGRTFPADHYVEIYYVEIRDYLTKREAYYSSFHFMFPLAQQQAFMLSVVDHEYLHEALTNMGVPALDQHQMMKDKYMDPLLNYASDYVKANRDGIHRSLAFGSLDAGISDDENAKHFEKRQNGDADAGTTEPQKARYVLPCGLMVK